MEKKILEFIISYIQQHGYGPTVREICDGVQLASTSSVHCYLKMMLKKGKIESDAGIGSSRAIRVPGYHFVKQQELAIDRKNREAVEMIDINFKRQWIRAKKALSKGRYLVSCEDEVFIAEFDGKQWINDDNGLDIDSVDAWMPLPSPLPKKYRWRSSEG